MGLYIGEAREAKDEPATSYDEPGPSGGPKTPLRHNPVSLPDLPAEIHLEVCELGVQVAFLRTLHYLDPGAALF